MKEHRARKKKLKECKRAEEQESKCTYTHMRERMANLVGTVIDILSMFSHSIFTSYRLTIKDCVYTHS